VSSALPKPASEETIMEKLSKRDTRDNIGLTNDKDTGASNILGWGGGGFKMHLPEVKAKYVRSLIFMSGLCFATLGCDRPQQLDNV
jgi:hypothetical protein